MADARKAVPLRLPIDLYDELETARGQVPREAWIRDAIREKLDDDARGQLRLRADPKNRVTVPRRRDVTPFQRGKK